jgi:hypothetical protein
LLCLPQTVHVGLASAGASPAALWTPPPVVAQIGATVASPLPATVPGPPYGVHAWARQHSSADDLSAIPAARIRDRHNGVPGRKKGFLPRQEEGPFFPGRKKGRPKGSKTMLRRESGLPARDHQSSRGWEYQFQKIVQFKQHHGHCVVPVSLVPPKAKEQHHTGANPSSAPAVQQGPDARPGAGSIAEVQMQRYARLGRWVAAQRVFYKRRCLSARRVWRLENLGFVWMVTPGRKRRDGAVQAFPPAVDLDRDDEVAVSWEDRYAQLVSFRSEHGHCNVPYKSLEAGGTNSDKFAL